MCSFALLPLGMVLVGPAQDAIGRTAVLGVALIACVVPPLVCLPVRGMFEFRTPQDEPATASASG
jgi:hypothetical protein